MLISWKTTRQLHLFFAETRTITSVTIRKSNGGKIACESEKTEVGSPLASWIYWLPSGGNSLVDSILGLDMGMLKGFMVLFRHFWYIDGWVSVPDPFWTIQREKATTLFQIGVFAAIGYSDGSQNHTFRGIEMVEILKSTLSIPYKIFLHMNIFFAYQRNDKTRTSF